MATLLTFVNSRLDYLALHREMKLPSDQIQNLEKTCMAAMIKAVKRVSTVDIGNAHGLATAIRDLAFPFSTGMLAELACSVAGPVEKLLGAYVLA